MRSTGGGSHYQADGNRSENSIKYTSSLGDHEAPKFTTSDKVTIANYLNASNYLQLMITIEQSSKTICLKMVNL
ncbi:hypothetical protein TYRP_010878 [Tyrophagus putrescentiae]|nr:hypothetical protein TYRP_010878 [Tyrophagus putrescentiae]